MVAGLGVGAGVRAILGGGRRAESRRERRRRGGASKGEYCRRETLER